MKVKASPELGKLLTRAVEALETIAAAAHAITAEHLVAANEAENWREYDRLSEPEAVPGHEWVYSSSEGWQLVPDEEIAGSEANGEVSGGGDKKTPFDEYREMLQQEGLADIGDIPPPGVRGHGWCYNEQSGWYLEPSTEIVDSGATEEVSGAMELSVGAADEAPWSGEERRISGLMTRRWRSIPPSSPAGYRRSGKERRFGYEHMLNIREHKEGPPGMRQHVRRQGDRLLDSLPRRQEGDDIHGRRQSDDQQIVADLFGEKFDDLVGETFDEAAAVSDEKETPQQREERRSPPANRRDETEQRMRTRRRPHDRRKRVKLGWMDDIRSGDERRDDVDRRNPSGPRRFNDGRRESDS